MIHLALQTEYSFKQCFGPIEETVRLAAEQGSSAVGIADIQNTYGHVQWVKACKKYGVKPILGVRINVIPFGSDQRRCDTPHIFIAMNEEGLKNIYKLVTSSWDSFYYIPRLTASDLVEAPYRLLGVALILNPYSPTTETLARDLPPVLTPSRTDFRLLLARFPGSRLESPVNLDEIAIINNQYVNIADKNVYQLMAGRTKRGDDYFANFNETVMPQHILSDVECSYYFEDITYERTMRFADDVKDKLLPKAELARWKGAKDLKRMCMASAKEKGVDKDKVYLKRLNYELDIIKQKDFEDYFMIVADVIQYAKRTMLVGPARGSSAGSLVCYLLEITEVDPIKFNLLFERFIDLNRVDLPDIDIDFPDKKREDVIKYLSKKYGASKVRCLSNVNTFQPKSAINEFASGLGINKYETEDVRQSIIERSSGDARAAMCISDTFETTDAGRQFISEYPKMALVSRIEGHASHAGKHAAGIIVSPTDLTDYAGVNSRQDSVMIDKKDAEVLGLLKIDCLGLRTLSLLEEICDQIGMPYAALYELELDDEPAFQIFRDMRLNGIFQFEGYALQALCRQMNITKFDDLVAITSLARPGALNSGGANRYVKYHTPKEKDEKPKYFNAVHKKLTEETFGICVFQEQMMEIARQIGSLSWEDVSELRKAASKSLGDEFFSKYKDTFMEGALKELKEEQANELWNDICHSGSWSFNKSHAVSYSLLSYWTAYFKANYPLEFAVASLNNAIDSDHALKLLRDMVVNDKLEYIPVDPDESKVNWSVYDGKLLGGLSNIDGIGKSKAKQIIAGKITPGLYQKLKNPITAFDILFPTKHYFGKFFADPLSFGLSEAPVEIKTVQGPGDYTFIGKLVNRNLRDLNEYVFIKDRGYKIEEENLYLLLTLEDDTDSIICKIHQRDFEELGGREIAEQGKIGESWYIVKGHIKGDWRKVEIEGIENLEEYM